MRGKVFFFTGASFCAIFFLEPSGNLLLEPSGSSWVPPDGSIFVFAIGSPPRMRGKVAAAVPALFLRGITPACAGKSEKQVPFLPPYQDHPRVCGEKPHLTPAIDRSKGSPPRMRGKAVPAALPDVTHGITPAYAGKSCSYAPKNRTTWDHPRVCGEKHLPAAAMQGCPGITPACAGKSARRQAGPPGPAPPPQMRSGWSPPPCTGRQCRTRKSTHARRARIPVPAHTPAPQ